MLTKTKNGYGLGPYEGIPSKLPSGRKITVTETRAALCRLNGLTQQQAAVEMNCSKSNVSQMWQSIFFKTETADALAAVIRLMDLGIIKHLVIILFIATSAVNDTASDANRPFRSRQSRTRMRNTARSSSNLMAILGPNGLELYSDSDLQEAA